jgi:hypothetical protein
VKRLLAGAAVPAVLAAGLVGVIASQNSAAAAPMASQGCVLGVICLPSPTPSSSATPSPSTTPTPAPSSSATPDPSPTAGDPSLTVTPSASASASASPASSNPAAVATPTASATTAGKAAQKLAATAAGGLVASDATWTMTASSATMDGFTYQGNVNMPVAGGGTVEMMEFTASSADFSPATTAITQDGATVTENDASFTASGVTLYATQLSGSLFGVVPVTFTPSTASALLLTNGITGLIPVTMTGVTADQTIIVASQAEKDGVTAGF